MLHNADHDLSDSQMSEEVLNDGDLNNGQAMEVDQNSDEPPKSMMIKKQDSNPSTFTKQMKIESESEELSQSNSSQKTHKKNYTRSMASMNPPPGLTKGIRQGNIPFLPRISFAQQFLPSSSQIVERHKLNQSYIPHKNSSMSVSSRVFQPKGDPKSKSTVQEPGSLQIAKTSPRKLKIPYGGFKSISLEQTSTIRRTQKEERKSIENKLIEPYYIDPKSLYNSQHGSTYQPTNVYVGPNVSINSQPLQLLHPPESITSQSAIPQSAIPQQNVQISKGSGGDKGSKKEVPGRLLYSGQYMTGTIKFFNKKNKYGFI